ncbi:hypothetical protein FQZ97_1215610 [compost metagenome]
MWLTGFSFVCRAVLFVLPDVPAIFVLEPLSVIPSRVLPLLIWRAAAFSARTSPGMADRIRSDVQ